MSQLWLVPDQVEQYIDAWAPDGIFHELRQKTIEKYSAQKNKRKFPCFNKLSLVESNKSWMMISSDVISFLQNMVRASGAKRCLDVGTFTGMSALAMALAQGGVGTVVTCDIDCEPVELARTMWHKAGVVSQIESYIRPAEQLMRQMQGAGELFDLVFIDAQDRVNYDLYYELALQLMPAGGSLIFDNAFMFGHVMDPSSTHENGKTIAALNQKIKNDDRVHASLLSLSDGVLWLIKV